MDEKEIYQEFYHELKVKYPDYIAFFFLDDCGDYVAYDKDAEKVAEILDEPHTEIKLDENLWLPAIYIGSVLLDKVIQKVVRAGKRVVLKENYEQIIENEEMETRREIKTFLDLRKGDMVYGGYLKSGGGRGNHIYYLTQLKVEKLPYIVNKYDSLPEPILSVNDAYGSGRIDINNLLGQDIYPSSEDYLSGNDPIRYVGYEKINSYLADKFGWCIDSDWLRFWKWNDKTQCAEQNSDIILDLLDPKLPEGYYATKEECEKANKKTVKVRITREYETEVDKDYAEDLVNNPGEYQYQTGDECHSSAEIIN